ncbi:MAG TPA: protein translocase subunit SecD [Candidatus Vogelbacteria bacterium]|nr:protein translocase subunit SecD [Candidatus Vogelbacteria bacterium]
MPNYSKYRWISLFAMIVGLLAGLFVYYSETPDTYFGYRPFALGLDLAGGAHLVYEADVSELESHEVRDSLNTLREVIERRINVFGVSEPLVQVEQGGFGAEVQNRLIVELPGITDINEALEIISITPELEFRAEDPEFSAKMQQIQEEQGSDSGVDLSAEIVTSEDGTAEIVLGENDLWSELANYTVDDVYLPAELSGRYLKRATVVFSGQTFQTPTVSLEFDREGATIFARLTKDNIGKTIGIFLDGELISAPVVREEIRDGRAEISGGFSLEEARELARNLNLGALPIPISLLSTQTVGPTLGEVILEKGIMAGLIGLLLIILFIIVWYRLSGIAAALSLLIYLALMLSIFKLIPVVLTAAGIAGFILSLGIALDANILIFERMKEELLTGKSLPEAITEGFDRAWLSIRDSNLSSIISAIILFWFGTSLIRGFALTFGLGVLVSMITSIVIVRSFLLVLASWEKYGLRKEFFKGGIK